MHPNCTYGFTDGVAKTGNLFFCSLLYLDASRQMAALSAKYGCGSSAQYAKEAAEISSSIDATMKDPAGPLWLAATIDSEHIDTCPGRFNPSACPEPSLSGRSVARRLNSFALSPTQTESRTSGAPRTSSR